MEAQMDAKKIYRKYPAEVRDYMNNVYTSLEKQYGEVLPEWRVSLDMIAYNYYVIVKCREDIEKNGLIAYDDRGRQKKNDSISTLNSAQNYILKYLSQFGLSLASKGRLKDVPKEDNTLDDLLA